MWSVALYGCEIWTLTNEECSRLEAFEMWVWRRIQKVSWKDKKSNENVFEEMGESRCLLETIRKRKKSWIGHVPRGEGLLREVMEGRMEGKRTRDRPRMGMIDDLKGLSYENMKRRAHYGRKNGG